MSWEWDQDDGVIEVGSRGRIARSDREVGVSRGLLLSFFCFTLLKQEQVRVLADLFSSWFFPQAESGMEAQGDQGDHGDEQRTDVVKADVILFCLV